MTAAQLAGNPLQTPPARPQAQHLRHVIRRLHHLPPWINPRRAFRDSFLVHSLSPRLSKEGAIPRDAEGAVFHGAQHRAGARIETCPTTGKATRARGRSPCGSADRNPIRSHARSSWPRSLPVRERGSKRVRAAESGLPSGSLPVRERGSKRLRRETGLELLLSLPV